MSKIIKCIGCGQCCRKIIVFLRVSTKDEADFYKMRGFEVEGNVCKIDMEKPCQHLMEDNRCAIYQQKRPSACSSYPVGQKTNDLIDGCIFKKYKGDIIPGIVFESDCRGV